MKCEYCKNYFDVKLGYKKLFDVNTNSPIKVCKECEIVLKNLGGYI